MGFLFWMRSVRSGSTVFSFESAMGITTFTMALFFLFSLYSPSYYFPMVMLPAAIVVTCPRVRSRSAVCFVLLLSGFCMSGDAIWAFLGQPDSLINSFSSSFTRNALVSFWILAILVRIGCLAKLAQLGFRVAINGCASPHSARDFKSYEIATIQQTST